MTDADQTQLVKRSKAPAISRAAAVLQLLGRSETSLSLNDIARKLDINPSTCLYVMRALVDEEFVEIEPATKRYSLGVGLLTFARQWLRQNKFADIAQPILDDLASTFDVSTLGVQIMGLDHIVAVAVSQAGGTFRLSTQVGSRFPALISATGRCIAAFGDYPVARLRSRFEDLRWDDPPSFEEWWGQVEQTRVAGTGADEGNYISGVTVLAAPVWKGLGNPTNALVAIGLSSVVERNGIEELKQALLEAGRTVSARLGGPVP